MEHYKPANTLVTPETKVLKATEHSKIVDAPLYQSTIDSLLYLSGCTRQDIAFSVSHVARFCSSPTKEHWTAVKCILRYLKGTSNYGLMCLRNGDTVHALIWYSDADWAGDVNNCKSTSGYLFVMSGEAVNWKSQKQMCVAFTMAELGHVALAGATQEATWIRQILENLQNGLIEPTACDLWRQSVS